MSSDSFSLVALVYAGLILPKCVSTVHLDVYIYMCVCVFMCVFLCICV